MRQRSYLSVTEEGFHHLAYQEWGAPTSSHPPVICVHGLTRNSHDFDALANYLSTQGRYVICPDVVGRGESDWFNDSHHYHFKQYIIDMSVLIARVDAAKVDWIGTSMGGLIGMMMAAMPNTPIRRLIMNDVGPQLPVHALWRMAKFAKAPNFFSKEEAKNYFKKVYADFGNLSEEQWLRFTEHSIKEYSPGLYKVKVDPSITEGKGVGQFMKEFVHSPYKALEGVLYDMDLWALWHEVKCPVLIIHGRKSDLLLPSHIQKMQKTHAEVDLLEIADAGHAPALLELMHHKKIAAWLSTTKSRRYPSRRG